MLNGWTLETPPPTADGQRAQTITVTKVDPAGITGIVLRHDLQLKVISSMLPKQQSKNIQTASQPITTKPNGNQFKNLEYFSKEVGQTLEYNFIIESIRFYQQQSVQILILLVPKIYFLLEYSLTMQDCSQVQGIIVIKDKIQIIVGESYTGYIPKNADEAIISQQLKANKFKLLERTRDLLKIQTQGGVKIDLIRTCGNAWNKVGTFTDIDTIKTQYPSDKWQYGSLRLNGGMMDRIMVTNWNRGTRIFFPQMIPHGDNPHTFHMGTNMFTRGTEDPQSKDKTKFTHSYVNSEYKVCCGCHWENQELDVYVRRL